MSNNEGGGKEEGVDSSPLAAAPSMEESIKEIRQKIRERQAIAQEAYQKFVTLANEESDHSKSALAELLGIIASTMESIWLDMEQLYNLCFYKRSTNIHYFYSIIFRI